MATTSETTYTHTCDLCGAECAPSDLRRLGRVDGEGNMAAAAAAAAAEQRLAELEAVVYGSSSRKLRPCDICPACQARPISELVAYTEAAELPPRRAG